MNSKIRNLINDLADQILDYYNIDIPISDIRETVSMLGGRVETNNNLSAFADGLVKKDKDGFVIIVSPYQSSEREKFTIAHEIGHLFLHMGYKCDDDLWNKQTETEYYRNGNSEEEYEASEFAASFLMPEDVYRDILKQNTKNGKVAIDKIASFFGVSNMAAINRGKWLGCLQW